MGNSPNIFAKLYHSGNKKESVESHELILPKRDMELKENVSKH